MGSRLRSPRRGGFRHRYPNFEPDNNVVALYEAKAGLPSPERSVAAYTAATAAAAARGADLRFGETVLGWEASPSGEGARVTMTSATHTAERFVISAGPWSSRLLSDLGLPLSVERLVQFWFMPEGGVEPFAVRRQPVYIRELGGGVQFYGFPDHNHPEDGSKVAFFRVSTPRDPDSVDRTVHDHEIEQIRDAIRTASPA